MTSQHSSRRDHKSASQDNPVPVGIGLIIKPRGVHGAVKVRLLCDDEQTFEECLSAGELLLWREDPGGHPATQPSRRARLPKNPKLQNIPGPEAPVTVRVEDCRYHAGEALLKLAGISNPEQAEHVRNCRVGLYEADLPRPDDDEFYLYEIEGLEVRNVSGDLVGHVYAVEQNPAHDFLIVEPVESAPRYRVPFINAMVPEVDIANRRVTISLPDGLIEAQKT